MRKLKVIKIIIIIIILLLILVGCIIGLKFINNKSKSDNNEIIVSDENPPTLYTDTNIKETETMSLLLANQDIVNKYFSYLNNNNSEALISILNKDYVTKNNINSSNVVNMLNQDKGNFNFFVIKSYSKEISFDHEYKYWVYGKAYTSDYSKIVEKEFIINADLYNLTFKITPVGNVTLSEYEKNMKETIYNNPGKVTMPTDSITSIEGNNFNKFSIYEGTEGLKNTIKNYADYYYFLEVTDRSSAYNLLNSEYRNKRFGSLDEYIKSPIIWKDSNIEYVSDELNDNKKQYIGIDKNGTYYIFIETSPMNYEIMLDSYTIPLNDTIEKYKSTSDLKKACMCLEFVKEMINMNDYNALYSRMNSTFKQNNYNSVDAYKNYIKNKYYSINSFEYVSYKKSENNYIINVKVKDSSSDKEDAYFNVMYIVRLNNDLTDFEFSFSA